jgi:hypothetical protein
VLADDYAAIVMRDFGHRVQQANAQLRWTGSGYEILVAVDPFGDTEPSAELLADLENHLTRYRRIGHDVRVRPAHRVGVVVVMHVCVAPDFLQGHVRAALLDRFSSRRQRDGRPGFFHPDRLTPGQDIHLSQLVTAALAVAGVLSATVTSLRRFADPHDATGSIPDEAVESGTLALGPLELARLDNDPAQPGNGWLALVMDGGR